ncbi:MAG: malonyl-ACP O-methyltransferase BioC [Betaproteobacteria bacterium]|nr:malonyl-ACP O-methyltransferase BioC [Betaproteobacteria bacterium]
MADSAKRAIRLAFDRAAPGYDASAFLQREIAHRLDEHLDGMKIEPDLILDAGCGTGYGIPLLRARYPKSSVIALDLAPAMLRETLRQHGPKGWRKLLARLTPPRLTAICADLERLPLAHHSVDMIWSSLALQWANLDSAFREARRVLKPGGLFLFASFGPDTLKELRAASAGVDGHARVNRFIDMHDVGDALVQAGFGGPVMEMETLTLTYGDLADLFADLRGIGAHTVLDNPRRGLMGKLAWRRLGENYERFRRADGQLPATYEVVYGHAWASGPQKRADGSQVIEFARRGR